jgi:hypothetical protein
MRHNFYSEWSRVPQRLISIRKRTGSSHPAAILGKAARFFRHVEFLLWAGGIFVRRLPLNPAGTGPVALLPGGERMSNPRH